MTYQRFLEIQKQYDEQMNSYETILNKAKKADCGLVLDSEKTDEWRYAKKMFDFYFNAYRKLNQDNKQFVKRKALEKRAVRKYKLL